MMGEMFRLFFRDVTRHDAMLGRLGKSLAAVRDTLVGPQEKTVADIFFQCVAEGDQSTVRRLLEDGRVGVNSRNTQYYNWTALHYAAEADDGAMVRCLLDLGANPRLKAQDGSTPEQWARLRKRRVALEALHIGDEPPSAAALSDGPDVPSVDAAIERAAALSDSLRSLPPTGLTVAKKIGTALTTLPLVALSPLSANGGEPRPTPVAAAAEATGPTSSHPERKYTLGDHTADGDEFLDLVHYPVPPGGEPPPPDTPVPSVASPTLGHPLSPPLVPASPADAPFHPPPSAPSAQPPPPPPPVAKSQHAAKSEDSDDEFDDFLHSLEATAPP